MRHLNVAFSVVITFLALFLMPGIARAQLFGAGGGSSEPSTFYWINPETGVATVIGPIGFERCSAMDFDSKGVLYATCERLGTPTPRVSKAGATAPDTTGDKGQFLGDVLITINPATGFGTEVGPTGCTNTVPGLSFRASDDTLFASCIFRSADPFQFGLVTIDTSTGATTIVGEFSAVPQFGNGGGNALVFSSDGTLYLTAQVSSNDTPEYWEVNQETGAVTLAGNLVYDYDGQRPKGMDARPSDGIIFAITRTDDNVPSREVLATLDESTGDVVLIGPTTDRMDALAWFIPRPPSNIPSLSPTGLTILGLFLFTSAIFVLWHRSRLRKEQ